VIRVGGDLTVISIAREHRGPVGAVQSSKENAPIDSDPSVTGRVRKHRDRKDGGRTVGCFDEPE